MLKILAKQNFRKKLEFLSLSENTEIFYMIAPAMGK